MTRRIIAGTVLVVALVAPLSAQWVVFDPANLASLAHVGQLFEAEHIAGTAQAMALDASPVIGASGSA